MAAQRATRIKDEFLATLSHELRTPLSAILGWTQILKRKADVAEARRAASAAIEVIDRNARAQVQLIDDLLDLSRIMTGKVRLDLQQVSLLDVVRGRHRVRRARRPRPRTSASRPSSIRRRRPSAADSGRLQQVVWNLLTNAIKFTPKGGQVQVVLQRVNSHIELSVSDTGIGIPASFLPHVFDRFSQSDSSTTRSFGGLGLGLAISKQLVELHGGTIRASSPGEGQGATFFVDLPLVDRAAARTTQRRPRAIRPLRRPQRDPSLPRLAGVHVFVVDDEPDARELLRRVLEDQRRPVTRFARPRRR